jgi:hypothetical protein
MSRIRARAAATCVAVAWLTVGCAEPDLAGRDRVAPGTDTIRMAARPPSAARATKLEPGALKTVQATPVQPWTGPGDRRFEVAVRTPEWQAGHSRRFGTITLPTALRTRPRDQYPCASCHLGRRVVMADKRIADAHQNIQPVHPEQTGAHCSTCHAADDVERLVLLSGERASLDEAYRLCAQCHVAQVEVWAGGAHGKRLDGWQGRRVLMGCADCHDPHRPALESRIPFRAPRIERIRGPVR